MFVYLSCYLTVYMTLFLHNILSSKYCERGCIWDQSSGFEAFSIHRGRVSLAKSILCWCHLVRFKSTVKWWWYLKILFPSLLIFVLLVFLFCTFTIFSLKEIVNVSEREEFLREIWNKSKLFASIFTKLESSCSLLKVSEIGFGV